jgi:hypothetical protein
MQTEQDDISTPVTPEDKYRTSLKTMSYFCVLRSGLIGSMKSKLHVLRRTATYLLPSVKISRKLGTKWPKSDRFVTGHFRSYRFVIKRLHILTSAQR